MVEPGGKLKSIFLKLHFILIKHPPHLDFLIRVGEWGARLATGPEPWGEGHLFMHAISLSCMGQGPLGWSARATAVVPTSSHAV